MTKPNKVSRSDALKIAQKYVGKMFELEPYESDRLNVYSLGNQIKNAWVFSLRNIFEEEFIRSTQIIAITKDTGKILYIGSAGDEG